MMDLKKFYAYVFFSFFSFLFVLNFSFLLYGKTNLLLKSIKLIAGLYACVCMRGRVFGWAVWDRRAGKGREE
uniref:Uncharacterized protein n=1 Tax=Anguilla anguilla TaxID=7936 RepID=A0A0E9W797_ANGAN